MVPFPKFLNTSTTRSIKISSQRILFTKSFSRKLNIRSTRNSTPSLLLLLFLIKLRAEKFLSQLRVNSSILNKKPKKVTNKDTDKLKSGWWASCLLEWNQGILKISLISPSRKITSSLLERNWGILTISLILPSQKIAIPLSVCVWTLAVWTKIQKKFTDDNTDKLKNRWWASCLLERN